MEKNNLEISKFYKNRAVVFGILLILGLSIFAYKTYFSTDRHGEVLNLSTSSSDKIADFIAAKEGQASFGGKVFVSYEILDEEFDGNVRILYVWALIQEYYVQEGKLAEGTGGSFPIKIIEENINGEWVPEKYEVPGDGAYYREDIAKIFPKKVQNMIFTSGQEHDMRIVRLKEENRQAAKIYFGTYE